MTCKVYNIERVVRKKDICKKCIKKQEWRICWNSIPFEIHNLWEVESNRIASKVKVCYSLAYSRANRFLPLMLLDGFEEQVCKWLFRMLLETAMKAREKRELIYIKSYLQLAFALTLQCYKMQCCWCMQMLYFKSKKWKRWKSVQRCGAPKREWCLHN